MKQEDFQMPASYPVLLIFKQAAFHLTSFTYLKRLHCGEEKNISELKKLLLAKLLYHKYWKHVNFVINDNLVEYLKSNYYLHEA